MTDRKSYTPSFKAVNDDGTASWVMATMGVIDHDGDVLLPGAFGEQSVPIVPSHDASHVPLGKGRLYEDGNEVVVEAKFNLDIPVARDWHSAIKFDLANPPAVQEYSFAYELLPGGSKMGEFSGKRVRFFQPKANGEPGVDVTESSPVLRGAGINTRTLAAKSAMKLDQLTDAAVADVRYLIDRYQEVITFRTNNGKTHHSEHSIEFFERMEAELKRLVALREPEPANDPDDEVQREFARFVALSTQGG